MPGLWHKYLFLIETFDTALIVANMHSDGCSVIRIET